MSQGEREAAVSGAMAAADPFVPVANGSYQEVNRGTLFRYSGRFIFCRRAL
jgi:hypothetical protein